METGDAEVMMNRHYIESLSFPLKQSRSKVLLPLWQLYVSSLSSPDNKPSSQGRMNDFPSQFLNLIQRKHLSHTNPFSFCSSETKLITFIYYNVINFWYFFLYNFINGLPKTTWKTCVYMSYRKFQSLERIGK